MCTAEKVCRALTGDWMKTKDIADAAGVTAPTAVRLLTEFEEKGYVARRMAAAGKGCGRAFFWKKVKDFTVEKKKPDKAEDVLKLLREKGYATAGELGRNSGKSLYLLKKLGKVDFEYGKVVRGKPVKMWFPVEFKKDRILAALRKNGEMTAKEISAATGVPAKEVGSIIANQIDCVGKKGEKTKTFYIQDEVETKALFNLFYKKPPSKAGREYWHA